MKKAIAALILLLSLASAAERLEGGMPLVAVGPDGRGMITNLTVEILPGSGRTFFSSEPLIGIDTQNSERVAVDFAENWTNESLDDKDILFTIHTNATIVDGASAGAAMAVATISALEGREMRRDVMITGTLHEDGSIGSVSSVAPKAKAAADAGASIFFIPRGQSVQTTNVQVGSQVKTVTVNLTKVGEKWGVEIIEVSSIEQALPVFFGEREGVERNAVNVTLGKLPELPLLEKLGEHEISRARMLEKIANRSTESYDVGKTLLGEAEKVKGEGYPYSVANNAFLAAVYFCRSGEEPEVEASLDRLEAMILQENITRNGDPAWLGSAQLRYLWAREREGDCARAEWIAAAEKMLEVMPKRKGLDVSALSGRAQTYLDKAEKDLASAKAMGAEDQRAVEALAIAGKAYREGFYEAAVLSSVDSISYSRASTASGSMAGLEELSVEIADFQSDSFSEAYRRHALYLIHKGIEEESRTSLLDAIYLGYRARLYEGVFSGLPERKVDYQELLNPSLQVLGFALTVSVVIAAAAKLKGEEGEEMLKARRMAREAALEKLKGEVESGRITEKEHDKLVRELP